MSARRMGEREPIWDSLFAEAKHADLLDVAHRLGARFTRCGHDWVGPCPAGCAKRDGFIITPGKRLFYCRPSSARGDAVEMVIHVQGVDRLDALAFVLQRDLPGSPCRGDRSPRTVIPASASSQDDEARREHDRRIARRIAGELVPLIGTPGEAYLAATRKIDVIALQDVLSRTDAIGWHPAVYFSEVGHALHAQRLGCIVGVMTDAVTAAPTGAISRTYLTPDLAKIGKAKTLGSPAGLVRLSEDADVLGGLHLAEGLETALAAMSKGFRPLWATGSTALMAKFPTLPGIEALTIFVDHDENDAGERAAREAEACWRAAGREVHLLRSDALGDFNDALAGDAA
jgi:Toprim domain/CHC2 zinc finger